MDWGDEVYIWGAAAPLYNSKGEITGAIESMRDITGKKISEEKLRDSLHEKEVLLREVHHRVKNNLQIIHSLLNIQANNIQDETAREAIAECRNRVKSIALVHEKLYRSESLAQVDFAQYISGLTGSLFSTFGVDRRQVTLELDMDPIFLSIDQAIPCGLIVNELVSNCLKHAFPGQMPGTIWIELHNRPDNKVLLSIRDNGGGFSESIEPRKVRTLGLRLGERPGKAAQGRTPDRSQGWH